ncbi:MAG: DUF2442 domain-containing protein [Bacteroidales bacterium]|nr:DUF2442 domain-containing protein [Bacteroidales bacterium]
MNEIVEIKVLDNYNIWMKFNDGEEKIVCLRNLIGNGFTKELLSYDNFKGAFIEPGGGIAWENGFDICPNFLKEYEPTKSKPVQVH